MACDQISNIYTLYSDLYYTRPTWYLWNSLILFNLLMVNEKSNYRKVPSVEYTECIWPDGMRGIHRRRCTFKSSARLIPGTQFSYTGVCTWISIFDVFWVFTINNSIMFLKWLKYGPYQKLAHNLWGK